MSGLRRNLSLADGIAMSIGSVAPCTVTLAVSLTAQSSVKAAPLSFLIGLVLMICVTLAFCLLARKVANAGSVISYLSRLGNQGLGFMAGWALILCYVTTSSTSAAISGITMARCFPSCEQPLLWILLASLVFIGSTVIAILSTKLSMRLLLLLSIIPLFPLVYLSITVLHHLPTLNLSPFLPGDGISFSTIAYGVVIAVFAYSGFESVTTLGEELISPRKVIPLTMIVTMVFVGVFYILTSYAEILGFGLNHTDALIESSNPYHFLAEKYVSTKFAFLTDVCVALGSAAGCLAQIIAASRILFAIGRKARLPRLGSINLKFRTPVLATFSVSFCGLLGILLIGSNLGAENYNNDGGTIASLSFILVYLTVTWSVLLIALRRHYRLLIVTGIIGIVIMAWAFYASLFPVPPFPDNFFPYIVLLWLELGGVILYLKPSLYGGTYTASRS